MLTFMTKPVKYVVAIVLTSRDKPDKFLAIRRPDDDPDLRGEWGLPAATMSSYELPEQAALRVCKEKLNCQATPKRFLGLMYQRRNSYDIFLMDIEMELNEETTPDVHKSDTTHTAYVGQKWSDNPLDLMSSAKNGSCCSSIFLTDRGLLDRNEWIDSLEGSDLVM